MSKAKKGKDKDKTGKKSGKGRAPAEKVVRDSYTMPQAEHDRLRSLKAHCLDRGVAVKKSELLRAGLLALADMSDAALFQLLDRVERVKTGRPGKQDG